jgi:histidyl-tRNA synthetase
MWEEFLKNNLEIVKIIRDLWINTELFLDGSVKIQKQLKHADNKKIPFVVIQWEDEIKKSIVQIKNLLTWEQIEVNVLELKNFKFY